MIALLSLFFATACTPGVEVIDPSTDQGDPQGVDMTQARDMTAPPVDMRHPPDLPPSADMDEDQGPPDEDMGQEDMAGEDMPIDMSSPPSPAPTRYQDDQLISPLTPSVAAAMRAIYQRSSAPKDNVFMKIGASGTVSTRLLHCFAPGSSYQVDLGGRTQLEPTIAYFNGGDAAGATPFDRQTLAAVSGRSASWAISGSPSPVDQEISAINPRFAFINYGTNDMQQGSSYRSAMFPFYENMTTLIDSLTRRGIIPIITGLNPRTDNAEAARWVPTYNTLTRALAEARQIPYIDLYHASVELPDSGLLSDGIHGNAYTSQGSAQPCIFTDDALGFNYNIRNLLSLQSLDQTKRVTLDQDAAPDQPSPWLGEGSPDAPYIIAQLPFTHTGDTSTSAHSLLDAYPSCDSGQNEAGPERYYKLTLSQRTPVRIMVFDSAGVDIDLHLLGASGDPMTCSARDDKTIETTLEAGDYTLVLDTFVSRANGPQPGPYTMIVVACAPGDSSCN